MVPWFVTNEDAPIGSPFYSRRAIPLRFSTCNSETVTPHYTGPIASCLLHFGWVTQVEFLHLSHKSVWPINSSFLNSGRSAVGADRPILAQRIYIIASVKFWPWQRNMSWKVKKRTEDIILVGMANVHYENRQLYVDPIPIKTLTTTSLPEKLVLSKRPLWGDPYIITEHHEPIRKTCFQWTSSLGRHTQYTVSYTHLTLPTTSYV